MSHLWYQFLNVGVVLVSVVVVAVTLSLGEPLKRGGVYLLGGAGIYLAAILFNGCDVAAEAGFLDMIRAIDSCLNPYEYHLLVAQVFILSGLFVLSIAAAVRMFSKAFRSEIREAERAHEADKEKDPTKGDD